MDTIFADEKHGLPTSVALAERYGARNYEPLPVVLERGEGVFVWDSEGRRYLDCLSGYSALSQGHRHPRIIAAMIEQAGRLTLTSRAFHNDRLGSFLAKLCRVAGMELGLPMNTGAEAVETAIKAIRKWGYKVKGVAADRAEIIVAAENFHGRTTTIVGFSSEAQYRDGFGPFAPGFRTVPFGDAAALEAAIGPNTAGVLLEPIQGEAGVRVPPPGYLAAVRAICNRHRVLLCWDEVQTGLGRTGALFCHQHERDAHPDLLLLGKALGGGVYPVSAVLGSREALGVFNPGDHGSTFGGNPLAAAIGEAALDVIIDEELAARSKELGAELLRALGAIRTPAVKEIRGKGLFVGIELDEAAGPARPVCERLLRRGILTKDTHRQVIRLAPPLVIRREELHWLVAQLAEELAAL
jgi:ornithine--oxo-acid transaminase